MTDAELKTKLEGIAPEIANAIRGAASTKAALTITTTDLLAAETHPGIQVVNMVIRYAKLHGVHLWIQPISPDQLQSNLQRASCKQKRRDNG